MTYNELMNTIRTSSRSDWLYDDAKGIFTYRPDLDIRIERRREEDDEREFREEWANRHPDPSAVRIHYDIYYRDSFVESFMLVSVDGHRADLPLPDPQTRVIPRERYELARAVDFLGKLDEYIERSELTVGA